MWYNGISHDHPFINKGIDVFVFDKRRLISPGLGCSRLDSAIRWINLYPVDSTITVVVSPILIRWIALSNV